MIFDIRGAFGEFLAQAAQGNAGFPKTLDELAKGGVRTASLCERLCVYLVRARAQACMRWHSRRLVVSDSTDPDGVGFVQWRVTFYAAGEDSCIMNTVCLLDDFFSWKSKAMAKDIEIHVHPHTSCAELLTQERFDEDLNYEHYHLHNAAPEGDMPLKWHEAPRGEKAPSSNYIGWIV